MVALFPIDLTVKEGDLSIVIPVILTIVFYMIYWFISQSGRVRSFFYRRSDHDTAAVRYFLFTKILGFSVLGITPLIFSLILLPDYSLADLGLSFKAENISFTVIFATGLAALAVFSASFTARKAPNYENFPQIRAKVWTRRTVAWHIIGWALYLAGYEILFRGVLLMPLADHLGIWPAIAINIALYSAAHIPQGPRDAFGAIPVGLIFCLVTLASGTVYIAFLIHLAMALTNCFTAMKHHPDMSYRHR
ncbi:MAG TPA: CPBP family intramembrane glutamic endopeptidase [Bacteroidales bacterium]|nr:CPBP family intramembrane glutamic endopeptidase [Bacteroidales bacterium]